MKLDRIMLKLSGEALAGEKKTGFDEATVLAIAEQVKKVSALGKEIGIVIGGGNFWRGRTSETIDRNACNDYELYICFRDVPLCRTFDRDTHTFCMRLHDQALFQGFS